MGRARGFTGAAGVVRPAPEWRSSSVQACGLWPYAASTGLPLIGVPLGQHMMSGATVCSDPLSWFDEARLIANPSLLLLGRPGLGKSSLIRRMAVGLAAYGVTPMAFGDLKPDYRDLIVALGGDVVELGVGRGSLNVLDAGAATNTAAQLVGPPRERLLEEALVRRLTTLSTLVQINRGRPVTDHEETVLSTALQLLDDVHAPGEATLHELIALIDAGPDALRAVAMDRGQDAAYRSATDPLLKSIMALTTGAMGAVFARRSTARLDLTRPVCVDVSSIPESNAKLSAAALVACWSEGFGSIEAYQALVEAGRAPRRNWFIILDELWRVMRTGSGMGERVDALTRLDRNMGVGVAMITHNVDDAAASIAALAKRAGYYAFGGQAPDEVPHLGRYASLTRREMDLITRWSAPETWDRHSGRRHDPPGVGCFLLKVGSSPGIPVRVRLTDAERRVGDTNRRWAGAAYQGEPA
ncbi:MAG: ATP/GTP-binding protein [Desertimonas sp.]